MEVHLKHTGSYRIILAKQWGCFHNYLSTNTAVIRFIGIMYVELTEVIKLVILEYKT